MCRKRLREYRLSFSQIYAVESIENDHKRRVNFGQGAIRGNEICKENKKDAEQDNCDKINPEQPIAQKPVFPEIPKCQDTQDGHYRDGHNRNDAIYAMDRVGRQHGKKSR